MKNKRYIIHLAILSALASILSIVDRYVSAGVFAFLPSAKIGLANVIILISIKNFDFKSGLLIVLIKSLIGGLLFFGLTSFIISIISSLFSYLLMYFAFYLFKDKVSFLSISILGALTHTIMQLFTIKVLYAMGSEVLAYGTYLLIFSLITGLLLGLVSIKANMLYANIYNKKEE